MPENRKKFLAFGMNGYPAGVRVLRFKTFEVKFLK
jgi:hypothetical protein